MRCTFWQPRGLPAACSDDASHVQWRPRSDVICVVCSVPLFAFGTRGHNCHGEKSQLHLYSFAYKSVMKRWEVKKWTWCENFGSKEKRPGPSWALQNSYSMWHSMSFVSETLVVGVQEPVCRRGAWGRCWHWYRPQARRLLEIAKATTQLSKMSNSNDKPRSLGRIEYDVSGPGAKSGTSGEHLQKSQEAA